MEAPFFHNPSCPHSLDQRRHIIMTTRTTTTTTTTRSSSIFDDCDHGHAACCLLCWPLDYSSQSSFNFAFQFKAANNMLDCSHSIWGPTQAARIYSPVFFFPFCLSNFILSIVLAAGGGTLSQCRGVPLRTTLKRAARRRVQDEGALRESTARPRHATRAPNSSHENANKIRLFHRPGAGDESTPSRLIQTRRHLDESRRGRRSK